MCNLEWCVLHNRIFEEFKVALNLSQASNWSNIRPSRSNEDFIFKDCLPFRNIHGLHFWRPFKEQFSYGFNTAMQAAVRLNVIIAVVDHQFLSFANKHNVVYARIIMRSACAIITSLHTKWTSSRFFKMWLLNLDRQAEVNKLQLWRNRFLIFVSVWQRQIKRLLLLTPHIPCQLTPQLCYWHQSGGLINHKEYIDTWNIGHMHSCIIMCRQNLFSRWRMHEAR